MNLRIARKVLRGGRQRRYRAYQVALAARRIALHRSRRENEAVRKHGDELSSAVIVWARGYNGPGWYWWLQEYPDEGASGAFRTHLGAQLDAMSVGAIEGWPEWSPGVPQAQELREL